MPDRVEILLVEDNETDAELCIHALKKHHFANNLVWLKDGAEALDFLFGEGEYAGRPVWNKPSVILLDLRMPKVDGIEVLRRIRKLDTDIAVVIFTGYPNLESAVASMKLDAVDYIKKPFNVDEFREVLARVMRKKGLARTPEEQLHRVIGDTIRNLRKEKDLTLKQMSRRTGLSVSLLSQIERAESSASISSLYKIAIALESRIQDLFGEF